MQTVEQIADVPMREDMSKVAGDDIAYHGKRHCTIRREVGSSEKEAADDSKSEAELVDVADTLKRAISERMRVIRLPSHQGDTTVVL